MTISGERVIKNIFMSFSCPRWAFSLTISSKIDAARFLGAKAIAEFKHLKKRCDPDRLLESDLYRRVFA